MGSCFDLFIFFLCAFLINFSITTTAQLQPATYLYHFCLGTNFTANSTYESNLKLLLTSLSSNGNRNSINTNGFYNSTFGRNPDTVYGSLQCRGDVDSPGCRACVNTATQDIRKEDRCPISKQAIIWYDECMLRYSDQAYFSIMQDTPSVSLVNTANISNQERFNENLVVLMRDLRTEAVKPSSNNTLFASGDRNITNIESVYGLVQCTADLAPSVCDMCLQRVIAQISACCNGKRGGRRITPSCTFRYEIYPFLQQRANASPPPPARSPPGASPPLPPSGKGNSSTNTYLYSSCLGKNYPANGTYESNLKLLLSSLSSNSNTNSIYTKRFYNLTVGQEPDTVYGSFQCRGDIASQGCSACVNTATEDIRSEDKCPISKEAIIWYDECMLRYSNQAFFSVLQESPSSFSVNTANISNQERFFQKVVGFLSNLVIEAVKPSPDHPLFASGDNKITNNESVYGVVQCTSDLSTSSCDTCLGRVIDQISKHGIGGRILTPCCYIRYMIHLSDLAIGDASPPPGALPGLPLPTNTTTRSNGTRIYMVVIPVVAAVLLIAFAFSICLLRRKATTEKANRGIMQTLDVNLEGVSSSSWIYKLNEAERNGGDVPFVDFETILTATGNFSNSNKLGQGGFGPVYKGTFQGGQELAVKRLSRSSGQGLQEFRNEVLLIAKLQHRNLVKLLGYCITEDEKVLLYEYMPNKSLDSFIFDRTLCMLINWEKRLDIILGIARGILYLHQDSRLRIIHRDLKTSNILLDEEMNPKISDFGLARICGGTQTEGSTNRVVGTYGYMAPEYALDGLFSVKSDVYSFGVVLLEIISGKKNSGFHVSEDSLSFIGYAWRLWSENKVLEFIDNSLYKTCNAGEVLKCIQVGLLCVQEDANDRPTMFSAVYMLGGEATSIPTPKQPAFVFRRYQSSTTTSSSRPESCSKNEITVSAEEGR